MLDDTKTNPVIEQFLEERDGEDAQMSVEQPKKLKYQGINEIRHLIPAFKKFYYDQKFFDLAIPPMEIIHRFNQTLNEGERFYPNHGQYVTWRRKWDRDILAQVSAKTGEAIIVPKSMAKELLPTDPEGHVLVPRVEDLEVGSQTLAGALVNDANAMLTDDLQNEDVFTPDELLRRRTYILNVAIQVGKLVQGAKLVGIKANAEKRETAGFLMELMNMAKAGKIPTDEISSLQTTIEGEATPAPAS